MSWLGHRRARSASTGAAVAEDASPAAGAIPHASVVYVPPPPSQLLGRIPSDVDNPSLPRVRSREAVTEAPAQSAAAVAAEKHSQDVRPVEAARVAIFYTGGTIGMRGSSRGYVPAPGFLAQVLASLPMFHDLSFGEPRRFEDGTVPEDFEFVTPVSTKGRRAIYRLYEYSPLLDSCNISHRDWARIANNIAKLYDMYDAFIILHGTDTMSYTASALSFMLENLGKSVVVTGSQIPLGVPLTDGLDNLLGALTVAMHYELPEVILYFNGRGYRGNRTTKIDAEGFNGFGSANFLPLLRLGVSYRVHWERVVPPPSGRFRVQTTYESHVGLFRLFPGFEVASLRNALQLPTRGLVLQTFGAGNAPDNNAEMLAVLKEATDRGVVIVNITQCQKGQVTMHYATGTALVDAGVTPGSDMTVEAALTKLGYLFGLGLSPAEVRIKVAANLRGELSIESEERFSFQDESFVTSVYRALHENDSISSKQEDRAQAENVLITRALQTVLLCAAAAQGMTAQLTVMIQDGCDVNASDYGNRTPLHVAAAEGRLLVVRLLLKHGANPNLQDRSGGTPLLDAVLNRHDKIAKLLLSHGAELHMNGDPSAVLNGASAAGNIDDVRRWLNAGLSPNLVDYDRRTSAHIAASRGHLDVLQLLVERGADLNLRDRRDCTPLDEALVRGNLAIVDFLKDYQSSSH